jgi:hypothetical protein
VQPALQLKSISITYYDSVFIAVSTQNAMRIRHIVFCGLSGSTVCFHLISYTVVISKKNIEHEMCV